MYAEATRSASLVLDCEDFEPGMKSELTVSKASAGVTVEKQTQMNDSRRVQTRA